MQWTQPVVKRKILMPQTVYFLSSPAFYVSCLHWREGKMEIGRWEVVVVCRKEFMGSKVVVMLRCIFISTTSQCTLLPINWQDPYKANPQLRNTKGKHLVAQTGQSLQNTTSGTHLSFYYCCIAKKSDAS